MLIHQLPLDDAYASLRTTSAGLSREAASARRRELGANRIEPLPRVSMLRRLSRQFTHLFAGLLWVAALLALAVDINMPGEGMATLAAAIVAVIVINGAFAFWQEYRAEETMAALQRLLPHHVRALRDGAVTVVPTDDIVPGDVIFLSAGDDVPADCVLLEGFGVRVNTSTLTGESRPVSRHVGDATAPDLLQTRNVLLAGTSMTTGEAKALVFSTGMRTAFGQIAQLTQATPDIVSPLQTEIATLSRLIAVLALMIGAAVFALGQFVGLGLGAALVFSIGVIVANVPEGLLPTVTLAMAMAARRMAKKQTLVRHLPSVETLGSASAICTDKTGTLTQNRMEVRSIYVAGDAVEPASFADGTQYLAHRRFLQGAFYCHDLKPGRAGAPTEWIGDPMEVALVQMATRACAGEPRLERVDEIPFEPDRKRLVTIYRDQDHFVSLVKGAPEELLTRARWVNVRGTVEELTTARLEAFSGAHSDMAGRGLRVLGFAYRDSPRPDVSAAEHDLVMTALVGFVDPPRPEVAAAIQQCREAGITVIMVTGDHPQTAVAVAREIGLVTSARPQILVGEDLRRLSDTELQLALDAPEIVCARVTAEQKLRVVNALRHRGHIVAVTGDGVNDAPALRAADIGVAMGRSGTDVAREAADIVLLDDNFASIVAAIEEGRAIVENIRKFLTYILTSNVPELVPYLAFALLRVPLALTVIQILAVDLGTDIVPALGLGIEPPDGAVMRRPPRTRRERLLTPGLLARAYGFLGPLESVAAMTAFFAVLVGAGWVWGQDLSSDTDLYRRATAACLTAIVLMQVINVHLCRTRRAPLGARPLLGNRVITAGIALEIAIILLIDYTPVGQRIFGTAPLPARIWVLVLPFAAVMIALEEIRKKIVVSVVARSAS